MTLHNQLRKHQNRTLKSVSHIILPNFFHGMFHGMGGTQPVSRGASPVIPGANMTTGPLEGILLVVLLCLAYPFLVVVE